jgi:hypothetical protein
MDVNPSMIICFQPFHTMNGYEGRGARLILPLRDKLGNLGYSVSGRADFLAHMARTSRVRNPRLRNMAAQRE